MLDPIRDIWQSLADGAAGALAFAGDTALTLYAAMAALPLPVAVMSVAAGAALFHVIDQRAERRNNR